MNEKGGIYYIKTNGAYYIGKSKDIERRIKQHLNKAKRDETAFYASIRRNGYEWGVLEYCKPYKLNKREMY